MRNALKAYLFIICLLLTVSASVSFANGFDTTKRRLVVASEATYPPFTIIDKDGKPTGFSIELLREVAKAVNLELDINIGYWTFNKQELIDGKIDVLPFVARIPERESVFDFTVPYITLTGAVFALKSNTTIKSFSDLKRKRILVMDSDNAHEYVIREKFKNVTPVFSYQEAFKLLEKGNYDGVICQRLPGLTILNELGITTIEPKKIELPRFRVNFCFAVEEGDIELVELLNEGLSIVIADKTYDALYHKWFGPTLEKDLSFREMIISALYFFVPFIILISVVAIFILRREVKRRTKRLHNEVVSHKQTADALKVQQALLEMMERVSKVGGWQYEVQTELHTWTKGVFDIYGIPDISSEPFVSSHFLNCYAPDERERIEGTLLESIKTGSSYDLVLSLTSFDGVFKYIRLAVQAEQRDGKVYQLYGSIMDITQQKSIEQELIKLKDELEEKVSLRTKELNEKVDKLDKSQKAMLFMVEDLNGLTAQLKSERQKLEVSNKELEAFSYSVSHDLRAPLRAIDGYSRIVIEDYASKLDAEGVRLLNVIRESSQKMDTLIADLLSLSRVTRSEMKVVPVDMAALASSVFSELSVDDRCNNVMFTVADIPAAHADLTLIRQVWVNLIDNALKYSSTKPSRTIEVGSTEHPEELVYFIKDNGVGFSPAYKDKLFETFHRLHSDTEFEGTGVGLSVVRRIVTRHGGRVWADGVENEGATFWFTLPKRH